MLFLFLILFEMIRWMLPILLIVWLIRLAARHVSGRRRRSAQPGPGQRGAIEVPFEVKDI